MWAPQVSRAAEAGDVELLRALHLSGEAKLGDKSSLGTTAAYLAVLHDRPQVLRLLHELKVDLNAPCDATNFGTPAFYAAFHGRADVLLTLFELGVDLKEQPCEKFGKSADFVADLFQQSDAMKLVEAMILLRNQAATQIQRIVRGL